MHALNTLLRVENFPVFLEVFTSLEGPGPFFRWHRLPKQAAPCRPGCRMSFKTSLSELGTGHGWAVREQEGCGTAHGSAGVTPAASMGTNTTQSWWNWSCTSILPDAVHKHHQDLWLWDKLLFLCWFKGFLVEKCHVFNVTNSSPNSKLLLLSWATSTETKDWERFSFFH